MGYVDPGKIRMDRESCAIVVDRALAAVEPNSIIVLPGGGGDRSETITALPAIISGPSARGYRIVPACVWCSPE
jgi:peptidoglycan-N-acetylglucosamine deacetylase